MLEELFRAVKEDAPAIIRNLVASGQVDINATDKEGRAALLFAVGDRIRTHERVLIALLECGANINAVDTKGRTALIIAAQQGHTQVVKWLWNRGGTAEPTLLNAALLSGPREVQALLDAGNDVNAKDIDGNTALVWAARRGRVETVLKLIMAGADVNAADNEGYTVLMRAVEKGHVDVIRMLLEAGANPNATQISYVVEHTPLSGACNAEIIKLLIEKGASVKNPSAVSKLSVAVQMNLIDEAKVLLDAGVDLNNQDQYREGFTPLMDAVYQGDDAMVRLLLRYNPDVEIRNASAETVYDLASRTWNQAIRELFFEKQNHGSDL